MPLVGAQQLLHGTLCCGDLFLCQVHGVDHQDHFYGGIWLGGGSILKRKNFLRLAVVEQPEVTGSKTRYRGPCILGDHHIELDEGSRLREEANRKQDQAEEARTSQ